MLILTRKQYEGVVIGDITMTVQEIRGNSVRLGFEGPPEAVVLRTEVVEAMQVQRLVDSEQDALSSDDTMFGESVDVLGK